MARDLTPAVARIFGGLNRRQAAEQGCTLAPQLLLGLLSESECRAALILARHSVSEDDVVARWPELAELGAGPQQPTSADTNTASAVDSTISMGASPAVAGHDSVSAPLDGNADASPVESTIVGSAAEKVAARETLSNDGIASESEVQLVVATAAELLADFPQPLAVATEHLLLGLVAGDDQVGEWLREQGLQPDALLTEFRAQLGIESSPLPIEWDDEPANKPCQDSPPAPSAVPPPAVPQPPEEFDEQIAAYLGDADARTEPPAVPPAQPPAGRGPTAPPVQIYRVLDAAANRAAEGLRVLEDVARFLLNHHQLTNELKQFRHALAATVARLPQHQLLEARDTPGDVGTPLTTSGESHRLSTDDLLSANFHRVQESLRSLEEFAKLVDAQAAAQFKQLRYRSYTLHRNAILAPSPQPSLATARLYVLIDGGRSPQAFEILARSLIDAGVPLLQLRDKQLSDRELLHRAADLVRFAADTETRVIINDRADLAALVDAAGVHVGQEELPVGMARGMLAQSARGSQQLLGISTHSMHQARQAAQDGADYLGVGPTFPSQTKRFSEFPGLPFAQAVAAEISLPAYAIGGITLANLDEVLQTGIHGVAVSSAINAADDPPAAAREFLRRLS